MNSMGNVELDNHSNHSSSGNFVVN